MKIDEEALEHSVLDVTLDGRPMEGIPVSEPLEHSVLGGGGGALDSGLMEGMLHLEPLEHSVPLPAVDGGRVAWSSADGRLPTGDGNSDGCITTGFQCWNMDCMRLYDCMRHLMVCQCTMAVICMIRRIRIGTTRTPLPARHM